MKPTAFAGPAAAGGRMRPPGPAAFEARDEAATRRYSFESRPVELDPAFLDRSRKPGQKKG